MDKIAEIIALVSAEAQEHAEMRKELGAGSPELGRHAARLSGMVEVLEALTGKQYKVTVDGLQGTNND